MTSSILSTVLGVALTTSSLFTPLVSVQDNSAGISVESNEVYSQCSDFAYDFTETPSYEIYDGVAPEIVNEEIVFTTTADNSTAILFDGVSSDYNFELSMDILSVTPNDENILNYVLFGVSDSRNQDAVLMTQFSSVSTEFGYATASNLSGQNTIDLGVTEVETLNYPVTLSLSKLGNSYSLYYQEAGGEKTLYKTTKLDALKTDKVFLGFSALMNPDVYTQSTARLDNLALTCGDYVGFNPPVYRFWSDTYKKHFYTSSLTEKKSIIANNPNWKYEGIAFYANEVDKCSNYDSSPVYRFWSDTYNGHFYTNDITEKAVVKNNPNWKYEGEAYCSTSSYNNQEKQLYRFWSDTYRGHFYTTSASERDSIIKNDPNWRYEGIAYYVK